RCDRCLDTAAASAASVDADLVAEAGRHLRGGDVGIEPRRQWPSGLDEPKGRIHVDRQTSWGRALCRLGDGGWGPAIADGLAGKPLHPDMVHAVAAVLKRWDWETRPTWICPMPSRRNAALIDQLCDALSQLGKLPVHRALVAVADNDGDHRAFQSD